MRVESLEEELTPSLSIVLTCQQEQQVHGLRQVRDVKHPGFNQVTHDAFVECIVA